jgi:photosystem II stability/assembly factor-like uncharacterized protein
MLLTALALLALFGAGTYLAFGAGNAGEGDLGAGADQLRVPWVDPEGISPVIGSLDVNPADGSLWLATNTGLFRLAADGSRPQRVTGRLSTDLGSGEISAQLVIRFRGPDELVGSGHPPPGSALPSALGLIESRDGGHTWSGVSDVGYADFHIIQLSRGTLVAVLYGQAAVNVSSDGGETFENRTPPRPLVDLEVDPDDPARWIGSTRDDLIASSDEGRTWRQRETAPNARFAWPESDALYRIDPGGRVKLSPDGGRHWEDRGSTGGEPQTLFAESANHVYAALLDGTIKESADGGRTWTNRLAADSRR